MDRNTLRIATYNLWNSDRTWARRSAVNVDELELLDAHIVAMQEAPTQATDTQTFIEFFREKTSCPHALHL